jgi:hypothetical protein
MNLFGRAGTIDELKSGTTTIEDGAEAPLGYKHHSLKKPKI